MKKIDKMLMELSNQTESNKLSPDEKERILNMTMHKIRHQKVKKIYPKYAKVAGFILVITIALTSVVTATTSLKGTLASYFGTNGVGTDAVQATLDNAECVSNGVKVKAAQVIGDKYGIYVGLQVTNVKDVTSEPTFKHVSAVVDPESSLQCSSSNYMGVDEGVQSFIYHINSKETMTGKTITLTFEDYGFWNDKGKFVNVAKGKWTLTWELNYVETSKTIDVNQDVHIGNQTYFLKNVILSPLSVTAHFSENPKINNIPVVVAFMDGTLSDVDHARKYDVYDKDNTITLSFHKIVKEQDVESITIGDLVIPVTKNDNPIKRTCYTNPAMDVSISMPDSLYRIMWAKKVKTYHDNDVNAKTDCLEFMGKIDGVKCSLFCFYRIHKVYTEDEVEELCPPMNFVAQKNGCTYTVVFGEPDTEEKLYTFADTMNNDVSPIVPWISVTDN